MKRRDFVLKSLITMASSPWINLLGARTRAFANASDPHFFVLLMVEGGMDVTLGLDPRLHIKGEGQQDVFLEYRPEQIIQKNGIRLGPAAKSLESFSQDILIVNGINMRRDAGHLALQEYLFTGNGAGTEGYLSAKLGYHRLFRDPIDVLTSGYSFNSGNLPLTTMSLNSTMQDSKSTDKISLFDKEFYIEDGTFGGMVETSEYINQKIQKIQTQLKENSKSDITKESIENFVAHLFKEGLSSCFSMELKTSGGMGFQLDTHSNHAGQEGKPGTHWTQQELVWNRVSEIFSTFKSTEFRGASLFDYTTFMVGSEFSRSPFLNAANGKDHNPFTNSVLLAGKNIQGGKAIGSSHVITRKKSPTGNAIHIGSVLNYKSGQEIPYGTSIKDKYEGLIFPENLASSVLSAFASSASPKLQKPEALVIPGLIKS